MQAALALEKYISAAWTIQGWSCHEGGFSGEKERWVLTRQVQYILACLGNIQCHSSKVPGVLNYFSSRNLEVAHGESKTEESCLEKERELQVSLFIKDVLGGNVMKVPEGMGSAKRWVSHMSKRGLPRGLEGAVCGSTELQTEAVSHRAADLGRSVTKSE